MMLKVRLKEAMEDYRRRTGERITYEQLAERTGLARATLESLATRDHYNARLSTIEKVCVALGCKPGELLVLIEDNEDRGW